MREERNKRKRWVISVFRTQRRIDTELSERYKKKKRERAKGTELFCYPLALAKIGRRTGRNIWLPLPSLMLIVISLLVDPQVSLDSRVREIVNRNMVDPTPHTFDEAQLQIYTLMHRDSYPRFVNSAYYKKLAQLSSTSRKESSA